MHFFPRYRPHRLDGLAAYVGMHAYFGLKAMRSHARTASKVALCVTNTMCTHSKSMQTIMNAAKGMHALFVCFYKCPQ